MSVSILQVRNLACFQNFIFRILQDYFIIFKNILKSRLFS